MTVWESQYANTESTGDVCGENGKESLQLYITGMTRSSEIILMYIYKENDKLLVDIYLNIIRKY
jgi:hypothetical protein